MRTDWEAGSIPPGGDWGSLPAVPSTIMEVFEKMEPSSGPPSTGEETTGAN